MVTTRPAPPAGDRVDPAPTLHGVPASPRRRPAPCRARGLDYVRRGRHEPRAAPAAVARPRARAPGRPARTPRTGRATDRRSGPPWQNACASSASASRLGKRARRRRGQRQRARARGPRARQFVEGRRLTGVKARQRCAAARSGAHPRRARPEIAGDRPDVGTGGARRPRRRRRTSARSRGSPDVEAGRRDPPGGQLHGPRRRTRVYARAPSTLMALTALGTWSISPTSAARPRPTASSVTAPREVAAAVALGVIGDRRLAQADRRRCSSLLVPARRCRAAASPGSTPMTSTPVAIGSSVPRVPDRRVPAMRRNRGHHVV